MQTPIFFLKHWINKPLPQFTILRNRIINFVSKVTENAKWRFIREKVNTRNVDIFNLMYIKEKLMRLIKHCHN
jgi:hypothetical protein